MAVVAKDGELSAGAVRLRSRIARRFSSVEAQQLTTFADRLLAKGGAAYAATLSDDELMAMVTSASGFFTGAETLPRARVFNPRVPTEGWQPPYTIVEACADEGPFVVDTVRGHLRREGLTVRHLLHPVFVTRRERDGGLTALRARGDDGAGECFLHVALDPVPDASLTRVESGLRHILAAMDRATRDQRRIRERLEAIAQDLDWVASRPALRTRESEIAEVVAFVRWLGAGNFVFLGSEEEQAGREEGDDSSGVVPEAALGVFRLPETADRGPAAAGHGRVRRRLDRQTILAVRKSFAESPVYPFHRMDEVRIQRVAPDGRLLGEGRFVGLFTAKALAQESADVPVLRRMLAEILAAQEALPGSHDAQQIVGLFNGFPKDELFWACAEEILGDIRPVLEAQPDEITITSRGSRPDPDEWCLAVMVSVPASALSDSARQRVQQVVTSRAQGALLTSHLARGDGGRVCLHLTIGSPRNPAALTGEACVREIGAVLRTWDEQFLKALETRWPPQEARCIAARFRGAFPSSYVAEADVDAVTSDIERILRLEQTRKPEIHLVSPSGYRRRTFTALNVYRLDPDEAFRDVVGILQRLGLRVYAEDPLCLARSDEGGRIVVERLRIQNARGRALDGPRVGDALMAVLSAVQRGEVGDDELNSLALDTELDVHAVDCLRMLSNYGWHVGLAPTRHAIRAALATHPACACALFSTFRARFASGPADDPAVSRDTLAARLEDVRDAIAARIIGQLGQLVGAITRTNFFDRRGARGRYIVIKVDSARLPTLLHPRSLCEVYVHSATMEGLYVRLGRVARGGIVHGTSADNLRQMLHKLLVTEELRHAGTVSMAAKGVFSLTGGREASEEAIRAAYVTLIEGLLDVTDQWSDDPGRQPYRFHTYDGADPFLAVAPDAGTVGLSDTANAVATERGFWLGDAFASGGSRGYDPRALGIAARGAWESVRAHLRDAGRVIDDPVVVIGAGDMTDDFFRSGMLLSPNIQLRAAVSRRYLFLDPDPDPEQSFSERRRLAEKSQGWEAYDVSKLSRGGMVLSRGAQRVQVSPEVRVLLGLGEHEVSGEGLCRAALGAEADVLWTGAGESAVEVTKEVAAASAGQGAQIRGRDLRAAVSAEADDRIFTPGGRVEYALAGGRINSFAVDSAADVDLGDHEVHLKILLQPLLEERTLSPADRDRVLQEVGDDLVGQVLSRIQAQHRVLSFDQGRSQRRLSEYLGAIAWFSTDELGCSLLEHIPDLRTLPDARRQSGLTRPELSVLLGCAKAILKRRLLGSPALLEDGACEPFLHRWFPERIRGQFADAIGAHRLRREIIAAELANEIVNTMGVTFVYRLVRDMDADAAEVVRAWVVALGVAGGGEITAALAASRTEGGAAVAGTTLQRVMQAAFAEALGRLTAWVIRNASPERPAEDVIRELSDGLGDVATRLPGCFSAPEAEVYYRRATELEVAGAAADVARRLALAECLDGALDAVAIAAELDLPWEDVARLSYGLSTWLDFPWLTGRITALDGEDPWQHRAVWGLAEDLSRARCALVRRLCAAGASTAGPDAPGVSRRRAQRLVREIEQLKAAPEVDLAAVQVVVREIGRLGERF